MNKIIETMVQAFLGSMCKNDASAPVAMRDALRAAKAGGWELCKLPEPMEDVSTYDDGWNDCLDDILRLELGEGDG